MMKRTQLPMTQRITDWIRGHRGVTILVIFGIIFYLFSVAVSNPPAPVVVMMETIHLVILFIGLLVFIYNFGWVIVMLSVDEGLNDQEKELLKWLIRRSGLIAFTWIVGVFAALIIFQTDVFILASANCFLLALIFLFLRAGENPLLEGVSV